MASTSLPLLVFGIGCIMVLSGNQTAATDSRGCPFPAIYNFGDSNSATGERSAASDAAPPPSGETFVTTLPGRRSCDGRLIIDFIAEALGLPYLAPFMGSFDTSFRHGANFATGGASILPGGFSPVNLGVQISQFQRFKSRTIELYNQGGKNTSYLPNPEEFSKALYTLDIGHNDLAYGFQHVKEGRESQVRASITHILDGFSQALQQLYKEGARAFWVHNTSPLGCLPYNVIYYKSKEGNIDQSGCVKPQNDVVQDFNSHLKNRLTQIRSQLPLAAFTYVDVYSAKYSLISDAKNQGFVDPQQFCCGSYYGYHVDCGKTVTVNGTVYGKPCSNPSKHISWDGIHYSEAANQWVANHILKGSMSDPPVPINKACYKSGSSKS